MGLFSLILTALIHIFKSKMTILYSLFTIQLVIYSLLLEIVKFDLSLVAKILIFQLVKFDYFFNQK